MQRNEKEFATPNGSKYNKINMDEQLIKTVVERANQMLKNEKIHNMYNSCKTKDEANEWLVKVALATLMIPIKERVCINN